MRIKKLIKRIKIGLYKFSIKSSFMTTYQEELVSYERICFKIVLNVISNKKTEFFYNDKSNYKLLYNSELNIKIAINNNDTIDIIKDSNPYHIRLSKRDIERLNFIFTKEYYLRIENKEESFNIQIKESLINLLDSLKNGK